MATGLVHVPRACVHCDRVWLASTEDQPPVSACPECGRPADVVPGQSYQAADSELFQRIEQAMHSRRLSPSVGHRLSASLSDAYTRAHRPARLLASLIEAIPELQFVQSELSRYPDRMTRALGMVLIVLSARLRSEARRGSRPTTRESPSSP